MNAEARALIRADRDSGDLWGWSMGHRFGIAETLHAAGDLVPSSWQFRAGAGSHDVSGEYPDCEWAALLESGQVDAEDLRHAGDVLKRYTRTLELAGRSY